MITYIALAIGGNLAGIIAYQIFCKISAFRRANRFRAWPGKIP